MTEKNQKIAYSYVRFSSAEQAKGASLERQVEKTRKWASENGYHLDEQFRLDHGVSAFRGKNAKCGELSRFLDEVKKGRIKPGACLIVESLDRLSRDQILTAQGLLVDIVRSGVEVVSLVDGKHYRKNMDIGDMIFSIVSFSRANEESMLKSVRVGDAWARRRQRTINEKKILTRRLPAWLKANDQDEIEVIPDRAAIVKGMFEDVISGTGVDAITRRLIRDEVEPWGAARKKTQRDEAVWHKSYVRKILINQAVTGKFAPSHIVEGKRVKTDTIEGYFPRIIDDDLFEEAQRAMASRGKAGGRTGKHSNLFRQIAFCGYCGSSMVFDDKGAPPKGGQYLLCSSARLKKKCDRVSIKYQAVEDAILRYCQEISIDDVIGTGDNEKEISDIRKKITELRANISKNEKFIQELLKGFGDLKNDNVIKIVTSKMDDAGDEVDKDKRQVEGLERELWTLSQAGEAMQQHLESMADLQNKMETAGEKERIEIRGKLQRAARWSIKKMTIYPDGLRQDMPAFDGRRITIKPFLDGNFMESRVKHLAEHLSANTGKDQAAILVEFINGHSKLFRWNATNKGFEVDSEVTADTMIVGGHNFSKGSGVKLEFNNRRFGGEQER